MEAGDYMLTEQYTYSHMVEGTINLRGYKALPVAMDASGMLPDALSAALEEATAAAKRTGGRPPRVLYTVPTGQNPTGRRFSNALDSSPVHQPCLLSSPADFQNSAVMLHRHREGLMVRSFDARSCKRLASGSTESPVHCSRRHDLLARTAEIYAICRRCDPAVQKAIQNIELLCCAAAGSTVPLARKAEIYAICRRYDVIVLEDDPYYYLQFPDASGALAQFHALDSVKAGHWRAFALAPSILPALDVGSRVGILSFPCSPAANRSLEILWNVRACCLTPSLSRLAGEPKGLDRLERSYLSLDTDGRVVRLDSFAKFLAPGLRLGWATGAPAIIQKLVYCITGSSLGACSTTQVRVSASQKLQQRQASALIKKLAYYITASLLVASLPIR